MFWERGGSSQVVCGNRQRELICEYGMAMGEIGVCWEGMRVRGCFATPRLHGVYRRIIKWAESFHIPGISTHIALDNSTSPLDQPQQRTFATLILIHDFQLFGITEWFTAGYMQATCRRTHRSLSRTHTHVQKRRNPCPLRSRGSVKGTRRLSTRYIRTGTCWSW